MKIIDLSLPLHNGMPVFPGDPEVSIKVIQTLQQHGWELRRLQINWHDGTHVNVPAHMVAKGKRLQDYSLDCFCGETVVYHPGLAMPSDKGVVFRDQYIDAAILCVQSPNSSPFQTRSSSTFKSFPMNG